jgi:hypothetical protein
MLSFAFCFSLRQAGRLSNFFGNGWRFGRDSRHWSNLRSESSLSDYLGKAVGFLP